jgi:CheY-like chemotaxis protein
MNAPPDRKKLILLAEDDASIRLMLSRALGTKYTVEAVADGGAALARIASPPAPDLMIFDVMMPGVDGVTVAKRARATPATSRVPIVFLTAKGDATDVLAGIKAGARHYVTKPFQLADLLSKIAKILGA